jgi:hypothetical protein
MGTMPDGGEHQASRKVNIPASPLFNEMTREYARAMTGPAAINYIPESILRGLRNYRDEHLPTGGFLYAVLTNDLKEAYNAADPHSLYSLPAIIKYVYSEIPREAVGSPEKYNKWTRELPSRTS